MSKLIAINANIFKGFVCEQNIFNATTLFVRLTNKFEIYDDLYNNIETATTVNKYFTNVVLPHKVAVHDAGVELLWQQWFKEYITEDGAILNNGMVFSKMLLDHDLSKFSAIEAIGYGFYNFNKTHVNSEDAKNKFALAWHHHKMNNPHHPEYWLSVNRKGEVSALEMPRLYIAEMLCDWIGASASYGTDLQVWADSNFNQFLFGVETRKHILYLLDCYGINISNL